MTLATLWSKHMHGAVRDGSSVLGFERENTYVKVLTQREYKCVCVIQECLCVIQGCYRIEDC